MKFKPFSARRFNINVIINLHINSFSFTDTEFTGSPVHGWRRGKSGVSHKTFKANIRVNVKSSRMLLEFDHSARLPVTRREMASADMLIAL
ncbi:hypothetical protein E2C01_059941 [Portunus trituberculatus]|uniref:Uncharacterized protein n=1 Tax=Portunus trituberculatus TaxID=210409 RepID=A0A5B7H7Z2_PORTR|nr:hypothetical protein [Portunus trituberculatus]